VICCSTPAEILETATVLPLKNLLGWLNKTHNERVKTLHGLNKMLVKPSSTISQTNAIGDV
jgi:hypothetical protein